MGIHDYPTTTLGLEDRLLDETHSTVGGKPLPPPGPDVDQQGFVYDAALQSFVWKTFVSPSGMQAALDLKQDAATAATDAELTTHSNTTEGVHGLPDAAPGEALRRNPGDTAWEAYDPATQSELDAHSAVTEGVHGLPNAAPGEALRRNGGDTGWEAFDPSTQAELDAIKTLTGDVIGTLPGTLTVAKLSQNGTRYGVGGAVYSDVVNSARIYTNWNPATGGNLFDTTKSSWWTGSHSTDTWLISRAPAVVGTPVYSTMVSVSNTGVLNAVGGLQAGGVNALLSGGAAGGDLGGTLPNPYVATLSQNTTRYGTGGTLYSTAIDGARIFSNYNPSTTQQLDNTKASWYYGATSDSFIIARAPAVVGTPVYQSLASLSSTGLLSVPGGVAIGTQGQMRTINVGGSGAGNTLTSVGWNQYPPYRLSDTADKGLATVIESNWDDGSGQNKMEWYVQKLHSDNTQVGVRRPFMSQINKVTGEITFTYVVGGSKLSLRINDGSQEYPNPNYAVGKEAIGINAPNDILIGYDSTAETTVQIFGKNDAGDVAQLRFVDGNSSQAFFIAQRATALASVLKFGFGATEYLRLNNDGSMEWRQPSGVKATMDTTGRLNAVGGLQANGVNALLTGAAAGGDLGGTLPSPNVAQLSLQWTPVGVSGRIYSRSNPEVAIASNYQGTVDALINTAQPAWAVNAGFSDSFTIARAPATAGAPVFANKVTLSSAGVFNAIGGLQSAGAAVEVVTNKGAASGYASLDSGSRVVQNPKLHHGDHEDAGTDQITKLALGNTSRTTDTVTSRLLLKPSVDDENALSIKAYAGTWGVGQTYGKGQAIELLKFSAASSDFGYAGVTPDDLILFRVQSDGAFGTGGNLHVATGLRQPSTYPSGGYAIFVNPNVDAQHLLLKSAPTVTQVQPFITANSPANTEMFRLDPAGTARFGPTGGTNKGLVAGDVGITSTSDWAGVAHAAWATNTGYALAQKGSNGNVNLNGAQTTSTVDIRINNSSRFTVSDGLVQPAVPIQMFEVADPAAPLANYVKLYARDNGAGKTQLCARFNTGAIQVIATEP